MSVQVTKISRSKQDEIELLQWIIQSMEPHALNPERDKYCAGFDALYEKRKEDWLRLTGKEWEVGE